ncbi:glycosyltransferase family 9 protein [Acidipila sp. EB88]|nr:glycosyltransferase family 9 protein [Acidipila sp. EB88]
MGDILHALPAVTALRAAHPGLSIDWAVEPRWRALLAADSAGPDVALSPAQPLVDHIHLVPAKEWSRRPLHPATALSILRTRSAMRAGHYDATLDLQGAIRSAVIACWAHAPRLLGEAEPREPFARYLFKERIPSRGIHVIEQSADVVRALFGDPLPLALPLLPHDAIAARWCSEQGVPADFPLSILLHPGAGWGAKRWPADRYARAAALVAEHSGARVVINAAPGELGLAEALARELHTLGVEPLLLAPTVGQLIELTRRVTLAIGGDTGPLHLAAALGKPTVGIFGPTDPARNGPFHAHFRVLRDPGSRRDHTRHRDPEAGLLRIQPEPVAEAALELLFGSGTASGAHGAQGNAGIPPQPATNASANTTDHLDPLTRNTVGLAP